MQLARGRYRQSEKAVVHRNTAELYRTKKNVVSDLNPAKTEGKSVAKATKEEV